MKASLPIFFLDEGKELVVDVRALGLEEAGSRAELVEEEQVLLLAQLAVVPLGSFLLENKNRKD